MVHGRALHFVFKIADRNLNANFYTKILGMKVLRHEEFKEGCDAACNGPYDGRWSKTMVGYGPEDTHFAIELTYNYNVHTYERGNDFWGITIRSKECIQRARDYKWPIEAENGMQAILSPDGYKFYLIDEAQPTTTDPVVKVTLACSDLKKTIHYWQDLLGLTQKAEQKDAVTFAFADDQTQLEFQDIGKGLEHRTAYGRIAFSCPYEEQPAIESKIKLAKHKILTPLISLDTPGKEAVRVLILADPDDHEICFVDDEGFRKLSVVDPKAQKLLSQYIKKDSERKKP